MNELTALRTETGKIYDGPADAKSGRPSYTQEARTGPIHYKEAYKDGDPWLDLDESYSEPSEIKGIGRVLVYPRLPNIVTVYQDICGYQIQSRSNPDHVARVELVSIDGQPVTSWLDTQEIKTYAKVHPYRVGIWKDFSEARTTKASTMRWKVTELGNPDKDSHPFFFRDKPEAFSISDLDSLIDRESAKVATMRWKVTELGNPDKDSHPFFFRDKPEAFSISDLDSLIDRESAKVAIQTERTRIDDNSWHWDELIPANAKLVDTDWQVGADADDSFVNESSEGWWNSYNSTNKLLYFGGSGAYHACGRFKSINIVKSSSITSAILSVRAGSTMSATTCNLLYCFSNADNPSAPDSYSSFMDIPRTSGASQTEGSWTSGTWYGSPELKTYFQTVVNRSGWASGNATIAFIMDNGSTLASAYRSCYSYEKASASAPKLTVTWTNPVAQVRRIYVPNVSWLSKSLLKRREI